MQSAPVNSVQVESDVHVQTCRLCLLHDKRYRHLASDTYIAKLSLLSVDCAVDDVRVLETARERDSCRRQAFAISHSSASSSTYEFIVLLYH